MIIKKKGKNAKGNLKCMKKIKWDAGGVNSYKEGCSKKEIGLEELGGEPVRFGPWVGSRGPKPVQRGV